MSYPKKVYAIQHNATKRIYIGSSQDVSARYLGHISSLRNGKHGVEDMQKDFDKYGEDFSLYILDEITYETKWKEYAWMRKYNSCVRGVGYNYKDSATKQLYGINNPPYREGVPEPPVAKIAKAKESYHNGLVDFVYSLTEAQAEKIMVHLPTIVEKLMK